MRFFKRPTRRELLAELDGFKTTLTNVEATRNTFRRRLAEMSQRLTTSQADLRGALDRARGLARDRDAMKEERDKARSLRDTVATLLRDTEGRLRDMTDCRDQLIRDHAYVKQQRDTARDELGRIVEATQSADRTTRDRLQVVINSLFRQNAAGASTTRPPSFAPADENDE